MRKIDEGRETGKGYFIIWLIDAVRGQKSVDTLFYTDCKIVLVWRKSVIMTKTKDFKTLYTSKGTLSSKHTRLVRWATLFTHGTQRATPGLPENRTWDFFL